jgi:mRNA interferase RelE/StbE
MKNTEGYRIRMGDYRILYDIDDQAQKIKLRKIGHRRDIYK